MFAGKYIFDDIYVDPFTFVPEPANGAPEADSTAGDAHTIMPSWDWDAGSWTGPSANLARYTSKVWHPVSHPDSNDYAGVCAGHGAPHAASQLEPGSALRFADIFKARNAGDPLWPQWGRAAEWTNFAPRVGLGYAFGTDRPVMVRRDLEFLYAASGNFISRR